MRFVDDEPIECDICGESILAGDIYQYAQSERESYVCCNTDECMGKLLLQLHGNIFQEKRLNTAFEKAMIYSDMYEGD